MTGLDELRQQADATRARPASRRPALTHAQIAASIARQEQLARVHNWSTPTRALGAALTLARLTGIPDIVEGVVHPSNPEAAAQNLADIRKRGIFAKWGDLFNAMPGMAKTFAEDLANRDPRAIMKLAQLAPLGPEALKSLAPEIGLSAADRAAGRAMMHTPPLEQSGMTPGYIDAHLDRLNIARRIGDTSPAAEEAFQKFLTRRTVRELHDQALGPAGGATIDPTTGAPTRASGYAVADPKFTLDLTGSEEPRAQIHTWLEKPEVQARLQQPGAHLASWRNPKTGRIEANISDVLPNREDAIKLGSSRGEEALGQLDRGRYVGDVPLPNPIGSLYSAMRLHPDAANIMPHQTLAFEENAPAPANLPNYIGAKVSRANIDNLGDALAHHLAAGNDPGTWLQSVQNDNPLLGTMLRADPTLADKVFQSASEHMDFVNHLRPYEKISKIAEQGGPGWDKWYGPYIGALRGAGVPEDVAQRVLRTSSVLSTRKAPEKEVLTALRTWQAHETGQPITNDITQHTNDITKAAMEAIQGENWATRPDLPPRQRQKISNYVLSENTGGQGDAPTLDTWHARAYLGENLPQYLDAKGKLKLSPAQWRVMQGRTISDAVRAGMPTGDFQARVWGGQNGYVPAFGQEGANRADWLATHLASGDFGALTEKYPGLQGLSERGAIQGEAISPEAQRLAQLSLWQQLSQGTGPLTNLGGLR
jgi:hypothetical protein